MLDEVAHRFSRLLAPIFVKCVEAAIRFRLGQIRRRRALNEVWKCKLHLVSLHAYFGKLQRELPAPVRHGEIVSRLLTMSTNLAVDRFHSRITLTLIRKSANVASSENECDYGQCHSCSASTSSRVQARCNKSRYSDVLQRVLPSLSSRGSQMRFPSWFKSSLHCR